MVKPSDVCPNLDRALARRQVPAVFDAATAAYTEAAAVELPPAPGQPLSPGAVAAAARLVVGHVNVEADVLRWLYDEEAVPTPYVRAAADVYAAAAEAQGVAVPASLCLRATCNFFKQSEIAAKLVVMLCHGQKAGIPGFLSIRFVYLRVLQLTTIKWKTIMGCCCANVVTQRILT